ncbi:transketolase [Candidatus Aerophobetes bacterium]|nr:transketolase [Candidatus Aerophobetes bacterium]
MTELERKAKSIRRRIIEILAKAGGGHYGGSLSCVEILTCLYFDILNINPERPKWEERDRFILSKGHAAAAFVCVLAERGFFPSDLLDTFNKLDSPFGMHPDMNKIPGCDMSTGSLGHGLSVGVGMALAAKVDKKKFRVFVLLGDGECQEGSVWEGAMAAAHYKLDNLIAIVDRNRICMDGCTEEIMALGDLRKKWEAFGWKVREINGHNVEEILRALRSVPFEEGKPSVTIANTVKGKGVSFMENTHKWHYRAASEEETKRALGELEVV